MILAAGFGTRLKPLTDTIPKALVKVNGVPMIKIVIDRLIDYGCKEIIVNTHYLCEQVENYFEANKFKAEIILSHEKEILGTGGGIKHAERYLNDASSIIVHNVDVMSDIDFDELAEYYFQKTPLAVLAVKNRDTKRPLIIDDSGNLIGRKSAEKIFRYRKPEGKEKSVGFCGIHILSSGIFKNFSESGFFDIFTAYFTFLEQNKQILAFDIGGKNWTDLGSYNNLLHTL